MAKKKRIDLLLVEKGFFPTREQARRAVLAGIVFHNQKKIDKCGTFVDPDGVLEVRGNPCPYVSRGGLKLEAALRSFALDVRGKIALDAGASTGGFTDCLLKHGVKKVYAVDVGYGQLAWKLRQDPRVVVMERTNIRYLKPEELGEKVDLVTLDLSFISLEKVLTVVKNLLKPDGEVVALIKPQFEAGRQYVGKGGIVKDPEVHQEVLSRVLKFAEDQGFVIKGLTYSPLPGADGNIEFLAWLSLNRDFKSSVSLEVVREVVRKAHQELLGAREKG
ncbi:MAG: RNA binding methyltransferase FtsJ like [Thermoanaerobacterales bacterium 50_218]|nr:MAG: RNA binding methyltransferase FtsJ like [Thermoanaerobacterales bacterium 50_218]HAA90457.1 TlyA family rRNA (cytidine-2'-O)-methyltransferase [Peptococcaceae bacterium]